MARQMNKSIRKARANQQPCPSCGSGDHPLKLCPTRKLRGSKAKPFPKAEQSASV